MEVGSVYRLDHSKLPRDVLGDHLGFIRAVMVGEISKSAITVSYPSKRALEEFFKRDDNGGRWSGWLMQPNLDLVHTMSVDLAEKVLCDRIAFEEFAARRGTRSFWENDTVGSDGEEREGGLRKWGLRKRGSFVRKHRERNLGPVLVKREAIEEVEADSEEKELGRRGVYKRKKPSKYVKKVKKKRGPVEAAMSCENGRNSEPVSETNLRWTKERYKLAEKSILSIMKAKGAIHGFPILRADLRAEARKQIGDTGLLDHLLKHMAGKVAPGGKDRFRRRHNPEGAMEYWLESADLVNIRKEAGVEDPYWIPPQGWKLGDSPSQDPVCARELRQLRLEVDKMKSEIQVFKVKQDCDQSAGDVPAPCLDDVHKMRRFLLMPLKVMQEDLLKRKTKIEEQLMKVSNALTDMETDIEDMAGEEAKGSKKAPTGAAINEASGGEVCRRRRQRMKKSGFRICKPEGSFVWPHMAASAAAASTLQVEDILGISSPSSVCSSLSPPKSAPGSGGVWRPVARRRSALALSAWSGSLLGGFPSPTFSTTTCNTSSVFVPDLNRAPLDADPTNADLSSVQKDGVVERK